jgi:hypothetical protein
MWCFRRTRGSTGYGQKFVDDISGDWGGKVYTDLLSGVAYIAAMPYIDRDRIGAAGGSYGGYDGQLDRRSYNDPRVSSRACIARWRL